MSRRLLLTFVLALAAAPLAAQTPSPAAEKEAVLAVMKQLFDGMRSGDRTGRA